MAWSWSHTNKGLENARQNLERLSRSRLIAIFGEWHAMNGDDKEAFDRRAYNKACARARKLPSDTLVDYIWEQMSSQALCDSGGYDAWTCPYGCMNHCVSFSHSEERHEKVHGARADRGT